MQSRWAASSPSRSAGGVGGSPPAAFQPARKAMRTMENSALSASSYSLRRKGQEMKEEQLTAYLKGAYRGRQSTIKSFGKTAPIISLIQLEGLACPRADRWSRSGSAQTASGVWEALRRRLSSPPGRRCLLGGISSASAMSSSAITLGSVFPRSHCSSCRYPSL